MATVMASLHFHFVMCSGENGSTLAPSIGTAVAIAVSAISFAFLPETKGAALPMTVKDAEELPRWVAEARLRGARVSFHSPVSG